MVGALGRHLAISGFMGAGKSTVGARVATLTARPFVDLDRLIEKRHGPIPELFEERGEHEFRRLEEETLAEVLAGTDAVIALGGGAVLSPLSRERLRARAFTVYLDVGVETAWKRVRGSDRPLAKREADFRKLYESRQAVYAEAADATAVSVEDVLLAALADRCSGRRSSRAGLPSSSRTSAFFGSIPRPGDRPVLTVPAGEAAKSLAVVERLWRELTLGRDGTIIALGGGSTTDLVGFVAATYLRGIPWIAVPTTLTGQVDAAIGGKTGINTADGKNLAGAFHFPESVGINPSVLATLPENERRAGMAEVVKTGLLAGHDVWKLKEADMIRACAAYKAGVVLSDPYETEGRRAWLNLGHTFAHALEAGSGYRVSHGEAVALGVLAALRLSGQPTDAVEEILRPEPVEADLDVAWAALKRDKKGEGVYVLLERPGRPVVTTVPDGEARAALAALIRQ